MNRWWATATCALTLAGAGFTAATAATAQASGGCVPAPIHHGAPPRWSAAAWSDSSPGFKIPYALASPHAAAAAFLFAMPLRAGSPTDPSNKVLWVMRYPRHGMPLHIVAHLGGDPARVWRSTWPADSEPGEIYPSEIDLPAPGCWAVTLRWAGHIAHVDLQVAPDLPAHSRAARSATSGALPSCVSGTNGTCASTPALAALSRRPLRLPHAAASGACPVSPVNRLARFIGSGLGGGPAYPVLPAGTLRFYAASTSGPSIFHSATWGGTKLGWVVKPSYRGPILIRGGQIGGPQAVRFGGASTPVGEMALTTPNAYLPNEPPGWRAWATYARVQAGGCYAFQIDGTSFSDLVVFRGVPIATPPSGG